MYISILFLIISVYYLLKNKRYRWVYIIYKTFRRDFRGAVAFLTVKSALRKFEKTNATVPKLFHQRLAKHPQKIAIHFEDTSWTFQDLEDYSNQVAHYFKSKGYKRGDTVAIFVENKPEYVALWLGLSKIGVVAGLINTNLVSDSLVHSLTACAAKSIIFDAHLKNVIDDISARIAQMELFQYNPAGSELDLLDNATNLRKRIEYQPKRPPTDDINMGKAHDKLLFIYTSGTTGLPKAAVITNLRYTFISLALAKSTANEDTDVWYDPLPLYHSAGGIIGVGQCIINGNTIVLRRKFSASSFWADCIKHKCTVAQYIGETCRYILAAHSGTTDKIEHSVKKMVGNGLRPQIWTQFVARFKIQHVHEFYGATEGNSNILNIDNTVGSVGFIPRYIGSAYPVRLVRCNSAGQPLRGADGFCIKCSPGQPGVFVGNVTDKAINSFLGYANQSDSQKKILTNVFKNGDVYFNSGDVLVQDEFGNFFFVDRTGDTFRWKGENVATTEIEAVISNVIDLGDAVVYGVEVPGSEGRAGMLAITDVGSVLDMKALAVGLKKKLPGYAIPLFVRVMRALPMTGTFKLKKTDLQREGFDIDKVGDKLFWFDAKNDNYVELGREKYDDIMSGRLKF